MSSAREERENEGVREGEKDRGKERYRERRRKGGHRVRIYREGRKVETGQGQRGREN